MADPQESQVSALQGVTFEGGELASLLNKEFKPKTDEAKSAVEQAVLTLAQQADLVAFMETLTDTTVPPALLVDTSR